MGETRVLVVADEPGQELSSERVAMTDREAAARVVGVLCDVLEGALEQSRRDLLTLQGVDRSDAEAMCRASRGLLLSLRGEKKKLEKVAPLIVMPGGKVH